MKNGKNKSDGDVNDSVRDDKETIEPYMEAYVEYEDDKSAKIPSVNVCRLCHEMPV